MTNSFTDIILSEDTIQYFKTQQEKLDENIRNAHNIYYADWRTSFELQHTLALGVEISEFINEAHDLFKYWKRKSVNRERIIDEAVDVLHFVMLINNKQEVTVEEIKAVIDSTLFDLHYSFKSNREILVELLHHGKLNQNEILARVLYLLNHYQFNESDVIKQYDTKNKENFKRIENNY